MSQFIQSRIVCNFCGKSIAYEYEMNAPLSSAEFTTITGFTHSAICVPKSKRVNMHDVWIEIHACENPICQRKLKSMPDMMDYEPKDGEV